MLTMHFMLIIECPKNKVEVPTGVAVDIKTFKELPAETAKLLVCPSCGGEHVWSVADVQLTTLSSSERDKILLDDIT
jgi:hypothetical protein